MVVLTDANWKLYARALERLEGRANGSALPIIRKLANRGFAPAVNVLSDFVSDADAIRFLRKAAHRGDAISAYNLAIVHRNCGDLFNYRVALGRAAKLDCDAADEMRRFRTRFPESIMRRFGRMAPRAD